jgi:uridylate kinase
MNDRKKILLKLTGEVFLDPQTRALNATVINSVIVQIKKLNQTHQFGIVVGGGNFFRGNEHGKRLGLSASVGHQIGMLATLMNGLILKDLLENQGLHAALLCAMPSPEIGEAISQQSINGALAHDCTIVFAGGTGNPFFTTDTNAILRSLQIGADEVWKGTNIDGIYDADPKKNPHAKRLHTVRYGEAFEKKLGIMDLTAYAMAEQYDKTVRVFNIFEENALIKAAQDKEFGSIITK